MATLQEIRAKLKAAETRGANTSSGGDNSSYPFWNLKEGGESVLRFLPDGNENNTFFWVDREMFRLPFSGIKGETENKEIFVQVPCMEMYSESCPILTEVRAWFKDPGLEAMGRKYWKKRSHIFQGFVVEDGLKEDDIPENPIRRFAVNPSIFKLVRAALVDPELDDLPTDYIHGLDFRIKKTSNGNYADYSTSTWSRRERPLNESELAAIKNHGLFNLSEFLPKKPGEIELKVMVEMFEASVDGEPYDPERWGQYFRPTGMSPQGNTFTSAPVAKTTEPEVKVSSKVDNDQDDRDTSSESTSESTSDSRAQDILQMIRSRQAKG